jgi:hypothetical protein
LDLRSCTIGLEWASMDVDEEFKFGSFYISFIFEGMAFLRCPFIQILNTTRPVPQARALKRTCTARIFARRLHPGL